MAQESFVRCGAVNVHFVFAGSGPVVFVLHGWGSSADSWAGIQDFLAGRGYRVVCIDLPGFGKSGVPSTAWGVEEYANCVVSFAEKLSVTKFTLIGHSFGGQVAALIGATHPDLIEKLILVAPAAIRKSGRGNGITMIAKSLNKAFGWLPLHGLMRKAGYTLLGRQDYAKAQGIMREIMAKVIRQDMSSRLGFIAAPTLLVWGDKDEKVPLEHGYAMQKAMRNARLEIIAGTGHSPQKETPEKFKGILNEFLP